ncbi:PKD domain-containing protein [Rhodococcus qingshengii]|uniref:PKD domain-containing protein n=1 Tax=Rhodococcus qingshengii TaxID=334542 RepID=UPI002942435A|nr:PKD domain-containing protein [Rhodococcus qingshengii]WOI86001.1 PKD domain-containing protein [Rhodococcus qingshengii]
MTLETLYLAVGTLNLANSYLKFIRRSGMGSGGFIGSGSGAVVNAYRSTVEVDVWNTVNQEFTGRNTNFHDVIINMGTFGDSKELGITGSPTFRSLVIRSKNNAAHTVNFDAGASITTDKFIAIGSGSSNKLALIGSSFTEIFTASDYSTMYGQYVAVDGLYSSSWALGPLAYIGSNSTITNVTGSNWLLQDPPKTSTLVDSLTTLPGTNTNWITSEGDVTQASTGIDGGGYAFSGSYEVDGGTVISSNMYDLVDSSIVFELPPQSIGDYDISLVGVFSFLDSLDIGQAKGNPSVYAYNGNNKNTVSYYDYDGDTDDVEAFSYPNAESQLLRASVSSSTNALTWERYDSGSWTLVSSNTLDDDTLLYLRSARIVMYGFDGTMTVGAINPYLGPVPANAKFVGTPTSGRAPLTVSFTDTSTGVPTSWSWNFGDRTTSTSQNPTKTYLTPGTYTVQLFASNSLGGSTTTKMAYITATATIITPTSIASEEAVPEPAVLRGLRTLTPASIDSAEAFGQFVIHRSLPDVGGIASAEVVGEPTIITGRKNIFPDSITSAEALDEPTVLRGAVTLTPGSANDGEMFGEPTVLRGTVVIGGIDSIPSEEAFEDDLTIVQAAPPPPPDPDWSVIGKEDQKKYLYKVYKPDGTFIGIWNDVKDVPQYTQRLYTPGTTTSVLLSRSPNTTKQMLDVMATQGSEEITDEGGDPLLVSYETNNSVGEGTDVDLNYHVDIYVIYGGFEPLVTQSGEPITTEDGDEILVAYGAPNGIRIFSGIILDYEMVYGAQNGVTVTLASHGIELSERLLMNGTKTTVTYTSTALETQAKAVLDADPGVMTYSSDSIANTGVSRTLKYQLNTKLEAITSIYNQTPDGWYWYGDVADNYVYMKPRSDAAQHTFWVGYHIKELKLKRSIEQLRNKVYFVAGDNGSGVTIFKKYEDTASQTAWRQSVYRITDRRYTLTASMQARADKEMSRFKGPVYTTTVKISSAKYDLERVKLGQMVSFRNTKNPYVEQLLIQIVGITYTPTELTLELGDILESQRDAVVGIETSLQNEQYEKIPDEPS